MPDNVSNLASASDNFLSYSILQEVSSLKSQLTNVQNEISAAEDILFDIEETLQHYRTEELKLSTKLDSLSNLEQLIDPICRVAFVAAMQGGKSEE